MSFAAYFTHSMRIVEADGYGGSGRTTVHRIDTLQVTGGLRHDSKLYTLSAGLSNQAISLEPITASDPGSVLRLTTNQPLDVRLNTSHASMLSGVRQLILGAAISAVFVTVPGDTPATVRIEVMGGGSIAASIPSP